MNCSGCGCKLGDDYDLMRIKCWACSVSSRPFLKMPPPPPPMRNPSVLTEPVHPVYATVTIGVFLLGLLIGYTCA